MRAGGQLGAAAAAAIKDEAGRRVEAKVFFGHVAYAGLVASRR